MNNKPIYFILAFLIATMGSYILFYSISDFSGFMSYMGFAAGKSGTLFSWILAFVVVVIYSWSAATISDVRRYMFKLDVLKIVSIVAAVCAGVVEEIVFRKWVMDYLSTAGYSVLVQIFATGVCFGLAHLMWGMRNVAAGINAAVSTFFLGLALGVVYWLGDRSLAPCIVAHFLITALIEPGLLISANNDRLGYLSEKTDRPEVPAPN